MIEVEQKNLRLLLSLWLREFESLSLATLMDNISQNAEQNGLTPELLNELLNDDTPSN